MKIRTCFLNTRFFLILFFLIFTFSFQESKASVSDLVSKIENNGLAQKYTSSFNYLVQEKGYQNGKQVVALNFFANNGQLPGVLEKLTQGGFPLCEGRESEFINKLGQALNLNTRTTNQQELYSAIQEKFYPKGKYKVPKSTSEIETIFTSVNSVLTENLECVVDQDIKEKKEQKVYTPPQVTITCGDPNNPFNAVLCKGAEFFGYVRTLASLISAFALVAFSVNAIFGNVNWKWFMGVIFGLLVISLTGALVDFIIDSDDAQMSGKYINDTLTD